MRIFFQSLPLKIILGVILVCIPPMLFLPDWRLDTVLSSRLQTVSAAVVALALIVSLLVLHRLNWFPGTRSIFSGIPMLAAAYAILFFIVISFRLPYSVAYLSIGAFLSLAFILMHAFFQHKHQKSMAYVPLGRANNIERISSVKWLRLHSPSPLSEVRNLDAIIADLHTPELCDNWQKFLAECALNHIPVYNIRQAEEALTGRVKIHHMYENTLGSLLPDPIYMKIKYFLEVLLIICSLPITLPIMLLTAILIKLEDGGSVFYVQERVGYRGKPFDMYKFRSMTENKKTNKETITKENDSRITRIGKVIRKLRIDELPQFLNVMQGDMSLIGPRAEYKKFADELEKQVPFYQYRHIVKPGITGWAQVMHGYATGADETKIKIEHDFYYIKHFSFWLDVLIVLVTIRTIISGFGAR